MDIISPIDESKAIIQQLGFAQLDNCFDLIQHGCQAEQRRSLLRLDLIHPVISGNKWYKLKYNLAAAKEEGYTTILTFGGAFSNHLIAAAAAANYFGMQSIGVVRGMEPQLTPTLKHCQAYGMQLHGVSRDVYKQKENNAFIEDLRQQFNHPYIIPEGGANEAGRKGSAAIAALIPRDYTHICVSVGSGTTLAGLREALPVTQQIIGFAPMKGGIYLQEEIAKNLSPAQNKNWSVTDRWHFGGFGKINPQLTAFMQAFKSQTGVELDRVYTAKMMYGVQELLAENVFGTNARILCIHTGGLQGN